MKQKTLQRYVFKIKSEALRAAKWDLTYPAPLREAIAKRAVISISSSQTIRFIDELVGRDNVDARAREIRARIKELCLGNPTRGYKLEIKRLYDELHSLQIIPEYLCVVIKNNADYKRLNKGFAFNGAKYRRLVSTSGGLKECTIIYVAESCADALEERLECGRDKAVKLVPAKFETYRALACSTSVPVSWPRGVVVVRDVKTAFNDDVITIRDGDGEDSEPVMEYVDNYRVELDASDGYGLAMPCLMERWGQELNETRPLSGLCVRNAFCKGMVYPFDFREFGANVAKRQTITDVWGNSYPIDEVELVLTDSMLKLWSAYSSMEDYQEKCLRYHYTFAVTKLYTDEIGVEKQLNYQFLQTLHLTDDDLRALLAPAVQNVRDICGGDRNKMLLYICGTALNEQNCFAGRESWQRALMLNPDIIRDPFILGKVEKMLRKRVEELKYGRIPVHGNFQPLSGDPYALCEGIFGMTVRGLLAAGEYYSSYWAENGVTRIAAFRAPMSCHNNIRLGNVSSSESAHYWYRYMKNVFILNAWDSTMATMNGCDFDGDLCFSTDNAQILKGIRPERAVFCQQKVADKVVVTKDAIIRSNMLAFGNNIGQITNRITGMIDLQAGFLPGREEHKILARRIVCGQHYQQSEIDKFKGIVTKSMPRNWYVPKACKDDKEKSICASRRPYFMAYTRPEYMATLRNYIKTRNATCERTFGKRIEDLVPDGKEGEFLDSYNEHFPMLCGNGLMNRLCRMAEDMLKDCAISIKGVAPFDYTVLKRGVECRAQTLSDVKTLYSQYMTDYRAACKDACYDEEERPAILNALSDWYRAQLAAVVPNNALLCEILLDIAYTTNASKHAVWNLVGDEIVARLKELSPTATIPVLASVEGGENCFLYQGRYFTERQVEFYD